MIKIQVNEKVFSQITTGKLNVYVVKLTNELLHSKIIKFYSKVHVKTSNNYGSYYRSSYEESNLYKYDIIIKKAKGLHKDYAIIKIEEISAFIGKAEPILETEWC